MGKVIKFKRKTIDERRQALVDVEADYEAYLAADRKLAALKFTGFLVLIATVPVVLLILLLLASK